MKFLPAYVTEEEYERVWGECIQEGLSAKEADEQITRMRRQKIYRDTTSTYQVNVDEVPDPFGQGSNILWLSIKRTDREAFHDWRILQQIKNAIVGPENEGFELYPAESRLVDTANQYHMFVFKDPEVRIPVGYSERDVGGPKSPYAKAKQRPFDEEEAA